MKAKKLTAALFLTAALLGTGGAAALAAGGPPDYPTVTIEPGPTATGNTTVAADISTKYTVVIPEKFEFGELSKDDTGYKTVDGVITAKNVLVSKGKKLKVWVNPSELLLKTRNADTGAEAAVKLRLTGPSGRVIDYSEQSQPAELASFEGGQPDKEIRYSFQAAQAEKASYAGKYAGSLTFTIGEGD